MDLEYEIDGDDNAVIVGLTASETSELVLLNAIEPVIEAMIPPGGSDPNGPIREERKQELIAKHAAAVLLRSLQPTSTRH